MNSLVHNMDTTRSSGFHEVLTSDTTDKCSGKLGTSQPCFLNQALAFLNQGFKP